MLGICKLCLDKKHLRDSHLMSAGVLRALREPGRPNADPILLTNKVAVQTSKPVKAFMLCSDCEDLFSKNGEKWVIDKIARPDSFPLYDALLRARPIAEDHQLAVYAGSEVTEIKIEKL